jgi:pantoate--beta-alanine ligase
MQFGEGEDLDSYPRTLQQDSEQLQKHDVDGLFTPSDELIYPQGIQQSTYVDVPGLTDILEGAHRPGHFRGVTTVVMKLFSIVQPDVALFGQKDYQQLKVIEKMVADLFLPIELMAVATQREQSGLALSSRNSYLDDVERDKAAYIYKVLEHTSVRLQKGEQNFVKLQNQAKEMLVNAGFKPDYVEIRNAENLEVPHNHPDKMVILAAVYLDSIRLIDNLLIFL